MEQITGKQELDRELSPHPQEKVVVGLLNKK